MIAVPLTRGLRPGACATMGAVLPNDNATTLPARHGARGELPSEGTGLRRGRAVARTVLAVAYLGAGLLHVAKPAPFLLITPDWVPFPRQVIFLTGLCEIAGAAALLTGRWRRAAGAALALYAVCVFPANIKHAIEGLPAGSVQLGWSYHAPRLAFQPVLVWWALFAGGLVTWPFRKAAAGTSRGT